MHISGSDAWLWRALTVTAPLTALVMIAVARGWTDALDRHLFGRWQFSTTRPDGRPKKLGSAARDIVALGGDMLRILFVLGCVAGLVADRRATAAGLLVGIVVIARLSLFLLKRIVRRPRPDVDRQAVVTFTSSFPSGHTFMAVVTYLTAAILIPVGMPAPLVALAIGFALVVAFLVGIVRIALGVHWPTDVAAGWCAGVAWTGAAMLLADRLLH
jgi:undecaprenyl-diphosphatase